MIYEYPDQGEVIRQGDIFIGLPRFDVSLLEVPVIEDGDMASITAMRWIDLAMANRPATVVAGVRPVAAIVATQDCDTQHSRDITLCEIRDFREIEGKSKQTSSPKAWKNILTQHARINLKWFYLPPDQRLGFTSKMGVDFSVTLRVARGDLEEMRVLRKARLNAVADEHFRERIAEFFRRYPYDEWYPLDRDELKAYQDEYPDAPAFPWQKD